MNNQVSILNYRELCLDPAQNPLGTEEELREAVAAQYAAWAPELSTDALREELLLDLGVRMGGGIGVMVDDATQPGGTLQVLHSLYKHAGRDPHRGKVFAYLGDIQGIDADVVEFDEALLEPTTEVIVADNIVRHQELLTLNPTHALVPAIGVPVARTQTLRVRNSVYIPYSLMPFVLDKDLTARQAFETLIPIIQDQGLEAACAPLLNFLIVASTKKQLDLAEEDPATATVQASAGQTPERLLPVIRDRRNRLLFVHLPDLKPNPGVQSDPALLGIMHAMRDVTQASKEDYDDRRVERARVKAPATVEERWPSYVDRLCKLCGVPRWEDLPAYWHETAAYKRGGGSSLRGVLQDQVDIAANALNLQAPQVTVQHSTSIQNFLFTGSTDFSLKGGVLPYTITPPGAVSSEGQEQQERDYERNADDTTLASGNNLLTAADARSLRSSNTYVPLDFDEADSMVESYTSVLAAILGQAHANVQAHVQALKAYRRIRPHLKKIMSDRLGTRLAAATLVYHYQALHRDWFSRQWEIGNTSTLSPPDLSLGFRLFGATYNLMWLPNTSHIDVLSKLEPPPAAGGSPRGRRATDAVPDAPDAGSQQRVRIRNNNRDPRLFGSTPLAQRLKSMRIKDLIEMATQPAPSAAEGERCLTWHLKGACYDDCARASDHAPLSTADQEALFQWVKRTLE